MSTSTERKAAGQTVHRVWHSTGRGSRAEPTRRDPGRAPRTMPPTVRGDDDLNQREPHRGGSSRSGGPGPPGGSWRLLPGRLPGRQFGRTVAKLTWPATARHPHRRAVSRVSLSSPAGHVRYHGVPGRHRDAGVGAHVRCPSIFPKIENRADIGPQAVKSFHPCALG